MTLVGFNLALGSRVNSLEYGDHRPGRLQLAKAVAQTMRSSRSPRSMRVLSQSLGVVLVAGFRRRGQSLHAHQGKGQFGGDEGGRLARETKTGQEVAGMKHVAVQLRQSFWPPPTGREIRRQLYLQLNLGHAARLCDPFLSFPFLFSYFLLHSPCFFSSLDAIFFYFSLRCPQLYMSNSLTPGPPSTPVFRILPQLLQNHDAASCCLEHIGRCHALVCPELTSDGNFMRHRPPSPLEDCTLLRGQRSTACLLACFTS